MTNPRDFDMQRAAGAVDLSLSRRPLEVSRRSLLRAGFAASAGLAIGGALASCSSAGSGSGSPQATPSVKPRRGGTLHGVISDSSSLNKLDIAYLDDTMDGLTHGLVYDWLVQIDQNFNILPGLAESWEPNSDGTVWTFKLRKGVTFSDGKTLTSEDVVWSMQRISDPKGNGAGLAIFQPYFGPGNVVAKGADVVQFSLKRPNFLFPQVVACAYAPVAQSNTTNWKNPATSGPFIVEAYNPGVAYTFRRNPNYWQSGLPYLDSLSFLTEQSQPTKVEAVLTGNAQLGDAMDASYNHAFLSSSTTDLLQAPGGQYPVICFLYNKAPYADPNVQEALRLVTDRQKMAQLAYFGAAQPVADIPVPPSDPWYPKDFPVPAADPEKARFLLKKAGQSGLKVTIYTSPFLPGIAEVPVLYKEMAAKAGINVSVVDVNETTYLSQVWSAKPSFMDIWLRQSTAILPPLLFTPHSPYNETRYPNGDIAAAFASAFAKPNKSDQQRLIGDALHLIATRTSEVIPCYADFTWPKSKHLLGITPSWQTVVDLKTAFLAS